MSTSNTLSSQKISNLPTIINGNNDVIAGFPTIQEIISKTRKAGADITHNSERLLNWYSNLGFAEKTVLGLIPFAGDSIDLSIQAYRLATGKGVDPVVVVLSSLGLGADVAAVSTFGGLEYVNAALAVMKAQYQVMKPAAQAGLKAIFAVAARSPDAMKNLRRLIPELASMASSGKLEKLLGNPDYVKFAKAQMVKRGASIGEAIFRDSSKSKISGSKDNEKLNLFSIIDSNDSDSLAQQRFDKLVADLEKQKIPANEKNIRNVLDETNLSTKSVDDIMEIAKQSAMSNAQMTLG
jgi:hypothetical protein